MPRTYAAKPGYAVRFWRKHDMRPPEVDVHQGVEMGRPCRIEVHAEPGQMRVGGRVSVCAEGTFTL